MNLLLNNKERNKKSIRKEVKKMKKIFGLCGLIAAMLLIGTSVFAANAPVTNPTIVNTTQTSSIYVEYRYNAYGVAISSTEVSTTTTRTTDDEGGWSETTSVSTAVSSWRGGSLKIDSVTGTSDSTSSDGASSHTDFWTNYTYNANGQLAGASGGSRTTGNRGNDNNGQPIGTFESNTVNNYIIRNGQALLSGSVTTGTNYGPNGAVTSTFTETTNYTYQLIGGSWHLVGEVSVSTTNGIDGSTETVTRTRTYNRDANGVLRGITQTASGTRTVVNESGGTTTYVMEGYSAEFAFDSKVGWYLAKESWTWRDTTPPPPPPASDPAITGNLVMINGELYMFVNTITDYDGTQSGEGRVVKIQAAEGQEAEFEALKQLVADNGGSLAGYTIWGDYIGDYTSQTFVFHGVGYGPFQPK